jgi:hypothetical protein
MIKQSNATNSPKNPFRGLIPFTENEGDSLFERDSDVELVISRMSSAPLTVLFATSGVGKTSFVRAKLIKDLQARFGERNVTAPTDWQRGDPVANLKRIRQHIAPNLESGKTNVVILDQFEEIFQHLPSIDFLSGFGEQLSLLLDGSYSLDELPQQPFGHGTVEAPFDQSELKLDVRVLISIREEFLGELSLFDSYVPALFSNFYRLRKPTEKQARAIIQQTVATAKTDKGIALKTNEHISDFLNDLRAVNQRYQTGTDAIDLPYLQIVCKQLWDQIPPSSDVEFLSTYRKGDAQKLLGSYCREILRGLSRKERGLLRRVLGQITGPKEAKKAVRLSDLALEIGAKDNHDLLRLLKKLSAAGILRKPVHHSETQPTGKRKGLFRTFIVRMLEMSKARPQDYD